jgi:hypothetical protein
MYVTVENLKRNCFFESQQNMQKVWSQATKMNVFATRFFAAAHFFPHVFFCRALARFVAIDPPPLCVRQANGARRMPFRARSHHFSGN